MGSQGLIAASLVAPGRLPWKHAIQPRSAHPTFRGILPRLNLASGAWSAGPGPSYCAHRDSVDVPGAVYHGAQPGTKAGQRSGYLVAPGGCAPDFSDHHFIRTETTSFTVAGSHGLIPNGSRRFRTGSVIEPWGCAASIWSRGWCYPRIYCSSIGGDILRSRHPGGALLASALGLVLITVNVGPRTIAIAYLALAAR